MKKVFLWVAVLGIFLPAVALAREDDWEKTERELNIQLEKLDADLKVVNKQATTEGTVVWPDEKTGQEKVEMPQQKLLGIWPVKIVKDGSLWMRILDWLAF